MTEIRQEGRRLRHEERPGGLHGWGRRFTKLPKKRWNSSARKASRTCLIDTTASRSPMGDPERYRKAEEVKQGQENDPIGIFNKYLLDKKIATCSGFEMRSRLAQKMKGTRLLSLQKPAPEPTLMSCTRIFTIKRIDK
ncbi:hypothetical protein [Candidatus Villigracilis affinis]|uniref:hypothetical protein n=1 Tax=Candidatus Villigracilis affinis TaxID=3140682 RepID=UPI002A1F6EAC|nr:hypothetical protein [Anaerolineales bacterium]